GARRCARAPRAPARRAGDGPGSACRTRAAPSRGRSARTAPGARRRGGRRGPLPATPAAPVHRGLTLLMLTPELAGRADLREGCPYGKAEKVHAGVPSGGGGAGAGYGSADRARGRGDRRGCATAGSLGPAGTRAARSASEPGDAFDRPGAGGAQTAAAAGP